MRVLFSQLMIAGVATALIACSGDSSGDGSGSGEGSGEAPSCVDVDGDGFGPGCELGDDCAPRDPEIHPLAGERCGDLRDNNCDGQADEDCSCLDGSVGVCYTGPAGTDGFGICLTGTTLCSGDTWGTCEGERRPMDETCDGLDNDCDGDVDEGVSNACGGCGDVPLEICGDLFDNDCDGQVDEAEDGCACDGRTGQPCYTGPPETLGVGACSGGVADCHCPGGELFCEDGVWGECHGQVLPSPELCDGIDNDCDGRVDEGLLNACGECGPEPIEICDNEDNDCDGQIDEGLRLACGVCPGDEVPAEICDGGDNDCDGVVDEGCACQVGSTECYAGPIELAGTGECHMGTRTCDDFGELWTDCEGYGLPAVEVCDGLDNDCNGMVDVDTNGCSVCERGVEVCDGIDNNCDGVIDEGLLNACGQCRDSMTPEEDGGIDLCNGEDDDCDGLIDEGLVNACGTCDASCYEESYSAGAWRGGTFDGLDEGRSGEGLALSGEIEMYPDLWVANSGDNTVTRINTDTGRALATYPVGTNPSRTAVDFEGHVWVANRAFEGQASVTRILGSGCSGADCVVATTPIGPVNAVARGLAVDAEGYAWVGGYNTHMLYRVSPDTFEVTETYDTGQGIYGLAIDSEGIIWISGRGTSSPGLGAFDTNTRTMLGVYQPEGCLSLYGIAVDGDGNVWLGNYDCHDILYFDRSSYEAGSPRFERYSHPTLSTTRGLAVDAFGDVWVSASGSDRLGRFNTTTMSFTGTYETCTGPIGVGVASDGNIWTMCHGADSAWQHRPDGSHGVSVAVGSGPYSYSDMTGFALRNFTAPRGTWRQVFDCGFEQCKFDEIAWTAVEPPNTRVRARGRTSADASDWGPWSPYGDNPASLEGTARGRYLELEIALSATDELSTPVVSAVQVRWQRP